MFLLCRYGLKRAKGLGAEEIRDLSSRWAKRIELHEDAGDEEDEDDDDDDEPAGDKPPTLYMMTHKSRDSKPTTSRLSACSAVAMIVIAFRVSSKRIH